GDPLLHAELRGAGFDPSGAGFRRISGTVQLTSLPFRPLPEPVGDAPADTGPEPPAWPLWTRPSAWPAGAPSWALSRPPVLAAGGLFWLGFIQRTNDQLIVLPQVNGRSFDEVAPLLHGLGLRVTAVPLASGDDRPGQVLSSEPDEGSTLRPGR